MVSIKFLVSLLISSVTALNDVTSPCPRLFVYEPDNSVPNRWFGTVTLWSEMDLEGIWLRLIFDREVQQLGNWFGAVQANEDNLEFVIKDRNHKLKAQTSLSVRFYADYDKSQPVPQLVSFKLNGKTICPDNSTIIVTPFPNGQQRTTSKLFTTTLKPNNPLGISGDDDYFIGDFGILNRQQSSSVSPLDECGLVTGVINHPWHANIYHTIGIDLVYTCSGTLISKGYVLTAGSCLYKDSQKSIFPDELVVYLGKSHLRSFSSVGIQDRGVSDVVLHSRFNLSTLSHNIALLKLDSIVTTSEYVRPVCLWREDRVQGEGVTVGWGMDRMGKLQPELSQGQLQTVSKQLCQTISDDTFCTIFKMDTLICNANSGGGYLSKRGNVWYLKGVFSVVNRGPSCNPLKYLLVTDASRYLKWIEENI